MASWHEVESDAPDFTVRVRSRLWAGTNETLATLRSGGALRMSASELELDHDGEITPGMMPGRRRHSGDGQQAGMGNKPGWARGWAPPDLHQSSLAGRALQEESRLVWPTRPPCTHPLRRC